MWCRTFRINKSKEFFEERISTKSVWPSQKAENKEAKHSTRHFISPCGLPKEMGLLGSEGSLTPCLLMEHTLKRYCSPLTRSNTGNRGDVTSMSRLAGFQLLVTTGVWGNEHRPFSEENNNTGRTSVIIEGFLNLWGPFLVFPLLSKWKWSSKIIVYFDKFDSFITLLEKSNKEIYFSCGSFLSMDVVVIMGCRDSVFGGVPILTNAVWSGMCHWWSETSLPFRARERRSDPFHWEGKRLPASRLRLGPAQHHVRVADLTRMHICGWKRNLNLTCETGGGGEGESK